jgi:C4-type Zn-finger protein
MQKECPLCAEMMQLVTRETITRVPGSPKEIRETIREWVCRECDYFEEEESSGVIVVPPKP